MAKCSADKLACGDSFQVSIPMREPTSSFESELRISIEWVVAALMVLSVVLFLLSDSQADPSEWVPTVLLALLLFAVAGIAGLLDTWRPKASRWFTVVALVALVHLGNISLGRYALLALVGVPSALAVALIGPLAAVVTAVGETMLILLLPGSEAAGLDLHMVTSLVATWAVLGVVYALYLLVRQQSRWVEEYFDRTQRFLEEARDHGVELEQTLESLAHANRQLALANERTATLRAIAEEAQRAKTAFVASVSHEFRTPLNMIIGLVDLMVETPEIYAVVLSPKIRKDLETVHRNCERLSSMIDDVLDLTRMEAGRLTMHREYVDLGEVFVGSAAAVRPLLEKKLLALEVIVPDDMPKVLCDRTRIEQVILNLLSNAARFTEDGRITIEAAQQDQHILVSVTDTGSGISPEDTERIFEPFWQGTNQLWRDKEGSGLGLSVSKRFVELHGGRMWLESKLGVGTTFFFTLPISSPIEHIARPGHAIREDWVWRERAFRAGQVVSTEELVKPRLIICDGPGSLYPQLVRYSDEVELVAVQGSAEAVRDLERCPAHAVVLNTADSDDLWSAIEAVRQQAPETPIMGCAVPKAEKWAANAGILGYLTKPVTRGDLERAIESVREPVRRVLVVDDDPDVLQLFTRMLHVCNSALEVVTASSGREALEELRRTPPDLMLLDVVMPDMDGWQVLEALVEEERIRDVPTFFVSAQDPSEQPPVSKFFLTTMNGGLSPSKLLRCSLEMSKLLLEPEKGLDLTPV
jgi:signal transduction histidine kinase/CheY-like chemotaxis protein